MALFEVDPGQAISVAPVEPLAFIPTALAEPQQEQPGHGVPRCGDGVGLRDSLVAASSSTEDFRWQTFHIDPRAWTFAKKGELCQLLARMSMRPPVVSSR